MKLELCASIFWRVRIYFMIGGIKAYRFMIECIFLL
jgi:hypothetical protein